MTAQNYDPAAYGDYLAADYDALYSTVPDTDDAVACLAELAGGGAILEMGIGTGRLARPLRSRGIEVHGIEASSAMVTELRKLPHGEEIPVAVGSFADTGVPEQAFSVVVLAMHTIFGLPTQDEKIRCFANAERHLAEGGVFVVEASILDVAAFRRGQAVIPRFTSTERVELQVLHYDAATQTVETTNVHLSNEGVHLNGFTNAYASPQELDLMARLGGLALRERWGSWSREPFAASSTRHISLYGRS
jgi:SAM-dependent methyltransferase